MLTKEEFIERIMMAESNKDLYALYNDMKKAVKQLSPKCVQTLRIMQSDPKLDGQTAAFIGEATGWEPAGSSAALFALRERGYVRTEPDPKKPTLLRYYLTEEGKNVRI